MRSPTVYKLSGLLALLMWLAPARHAAAEDGLGVLLKQLASVPGVFARFREEKTIQLLSVPLVSEGTVAFARPAALVRHVVSPEASTVLLKDGKLQVWDASGQRVIDLAAHPVLRSLAESFLYVLSGDRAALEKLYGMRLTGSAAGAWQLKLVPKDAGLARLLRELEIHGQGLVVQRMRLVESTGDVSVTTFTEVDVKRLLTEDEKRRLFAAPPAQPGPR